MNAFAVNLDDRTMYGATEVNGLVDPQAAHDAVDRSEIVSLSDKRLVKIVRLRLLTDRDFPFYDLSYCYGRLNDGRTVVVQLPEYQWPKRGFKKALTEMCKKAGVYGKGLGIFDVISYVD